MKKPILRYVALGDSTAVGVGARVGGYPEYLFQMLRTEGVPVGILNLGRSGATTTDLVGSQLSSVASREPALVTLGIGANDLWRMTPIERFRENVQRMGDALERTGADVLVSNISDLSLTPVASMLEMVTGLTVPGFLQRLHALNGILAELAVRPRFRVVDLCAFSREEVPQHPEYFCDDGFHPSDLGYQRWAELLLPHARELIARWNPGESESAA